MMYIILSINISINDLVNILIILFNKKHFIYIYLSYIGLSLSQCILFSFYFIYNKRTSMENKDDNRYHLSLWLKTNGYIKYLHLKYPSPNIGV